MKKETFFTLTFLKKNENNFNEIEDASKFFVNN